MYYAKNRSYRIAERLRKLREREESNARMAAKILAEEVNINIFSLIIDLGYWFYRLLQDKRQERIDIITQLQEQEFIEQNVQNDIAKKEKQAQVKKEVLDALDAQLQFKKDAAEQQRRWEIEFRKEVRLCEKYMDNKNMWMSKLK